jgi:hypothetical protein
VRAKAVFILLISMFVALVGVTLFRPRTLRTVQVSSAHSVGSTIPIADPSAAPSRRDPLPTAAASAAAAPSAGSSTQGGTAPIPMQEIRVVGPGWDVLAPGLIANQGREPGNESEFRALGLRVTIAPADTMAAVESALARGGADAQGADIAVVPLPLLAASYERIRALDPKIFYVAGWSRGREAVLAGKASMQTLPASGPVTVAGSPAATSTYLAFTVLDLAGIPPARVDLVSPDKSAEASFMTWDLESGVEKPQRPIAITTADATRLVPLVAVAQASWAKDKQDALRAWVRGWVAGQIKVRGDAAGCARTIGSMPGAPDPLVLVQRLGSLSWASLADNARMAGLSGRGAVTTESLFQHAWRVWRDAGLLTTPPPESPATEPAIIASLVRSGWSVEEPGSKDATRTPSHADGPVLLVVRTTAGKLDEDALLATTGWVTGLFDRSRIRVAIRGPGGVDSRKTKTILDTVADRFDVAPDRLVEGKKVVGPGQASVEVLGVR